MYTSYYNTRILIDNTEYKISIFMNRLFVNNYETDIFPCIALDNCILDDKSGKLLLDDYGFISIEILQSIEKLGL